MPEILAGRQWVEFLGVDLLSVILQQTLTLTNVTPGCLGGVLLKERHNSLTWNPYAPLAQTNSQLDEKQRGEQKKKNAMSVNTIKTTMRAALYLLGKRLNS